MSHLVSFYVCPSCEALTEKPDQNACTKCGHKRTEGGWSIMETSFVATVPAPNPRLLLSATGDLHISPKSFGSHTKVDIDPATGKGTLTIGNRWKFTFDLPVPDGAMREVRLNPIDTAVISP